MDNQQSEQPSEFQQSRTYENLQNAFQSALENSALFSVYGEIARQDGYIEISNIYQVYADNEREHATIWLRQLNEGELPSTFDNLVASSERSTFLGNDMYRDYARIATEEGYRDLSSLFSGIANIELNHTLTFQTKAENILTGTEFCKDTQTLWVCMRCGNILSGYCAPEVCPVCGFPQGFYRTLSENPV